MFQTANPEHQLKVYFMMYKTSFQVCFFTKTGEVERERERERVRVCVSVCVRVRVRVQE